ncbi:WDs protein, putative [Ichthyophthirius multifiliis]|uniref:WDs protein, putative n=1 Tax=Ichthyophthirius multifiliis TaxID=5932 RepID=G0QNH3_ICHMU|nr:WDs protein, putative [Ichthyophthirius multifiliis]EGR33235.1 WDs protein, putative [Ichthyophthirius multifiliis]|eukprot:XP_004037221.1 WDs protein, putative [Ichthyophthirius multifiliis]
MQKEVPQISCNFFQKQRSYTQIPLNQQPNQTAKQQLLSDQFKETSKFVSNNPSICADKTTWRAHDDTINVLEFFEKNKIATGSEDAKIKIWEKSEFKLIQTLEGHTQGIKVLKYDQSSRILASGGKDKQILIWRPIPLWEKIHILNGHSQKITCLQFQNEKTLISGSEDGNLIIWDIEKGNGKRKLEQHNGKINDFIIYNEKNQPAIVTASDDSFLRIWDGLSLDQLEEIQEEDYKIVCFDYNLIYDLLVYVCMKDGVSKVWVYSVGKQKKIIKHINILDDFSYIKQNQKQKYLNYDTY